MAASRSMGRTASTVGMMEGAFFVSRSDLIQWVNSLLHVSIAKVEQCASGAVYCQIIDACHPGSVVMRKVNWMARADHEFIPNYKVLQAAFDRNCIERHIDVDKLIRAKYQDNLEFLQWMKCYWEREGAGRRDYDPVQPREGKPMPPWARAVGGALPVAAGNKPGEKENLRPRPVADAGIKKAFDPARQVGAVAGRAPAAAPAMRPSSAARATRPHGEPLSASGYSADASGDAPAPKSVGALEARVLTQQEELRDLRVTLDGLERERDYYFRKLRDVEIMCTTLQAQMDPSLTAEKIVADVQGILYAENEEAQPEPTEAMQSADCSGELSLQEAEVGFPHPPALAAGPEELPPLSP